MGKTAKKSEGKKKNIEGEKEKVPSKKNQKDGDNSKSPKKNRSVEVPRKQPADKKSKARNAPTLEKPQHRKSVSKENPLKNKASKKDEQKKMNAKEEATNNVKKNGNSCFLCFCCGGNEDEELNELMLQQEQRLEEAQIRKEEELKKKEEEEKKKQIEENQKKEEDNKKKEEIKKLEEERMQLEKETKLQKEVLERIEETKIEQIVENQTVLKRIEVKAKLPKKKAQIVFTTSAAAPPPPSESDCEGPPPLVKETTVPVGKGIYLIYKVENNGQLELKYSKEAISGSGVLAYIATDKIPAFYFSKNNGTEVLIKDVKLLLQSSFIKDRIKYYEKWSDFLKMYRQFEGTLYLLPAFNASPPAAIDIIFLHSQQKKIQHAPVEKPMELYGDYTFIIQRGLEVFKKEVNVDSLVKYVSSFGYIIHN